jgi:hypothetical protein
MFFWKKTVVRYFAPNRRGSIRVSWIIFGMQLENKKKAFQQLSVFLSS